MCAAAALAFAPASAAAPTDPLGHAGRWITDAEGRVVVLHGFNTVPHNEELLPRDMGMGPDNAQWLAENGFNTIRLGLYYARVEPQPGQFDDAYLDDYLRVQQELADAGIYTLLDMHQDQLHPRYGTAGPFLPSRGFPEWFLKDDGFPNTLTPYPGGYTSNPALNRAYDSIWQNFAAPDGVPVQDHFIQGWQRIAQRFRERPRLLGYDIFNEPWPGTPWQSCIPACPDDGFDQTLLTAFNRKVVAGVRRADAEHLIFYEPNLLFDFGRPTRVGDPGDENAGFSYHGYCLNEAFGVRGRDPSGSCEDQEEAPLDNALAHSRETGDALLLTEFGWSPEAAERMADAMDERMLSWQFWDYYGDYEQSLHVPASPMLIRPYPQVIAGTPTRWAFDRETKRFEFVYSTRRADGEGAVVAATAPGATYPAGSRSEVFVPALHYPDGYRVAVKGAEVVSEPGARLLDLASCPGAETVEVVVTAASPAEAAECEPNAIDARLEAPLLASTETRTGKRVPIRLITSGKAIDHLVLQYRKTGRGTRKVYKDLLPRLDPSTKRIFFTEGKLGRTYLLRVRAIGTRGGESNWRYTRVVFPYDDRGKGRRYSRGWTRVESTHAWRGGYSQSSRRGATLDFATQGGGRVYLIAKTGPNGGKALVGRGSKQRVISFRTKKPRHRRVVAVINRTDKRAYRFRLRVLRGTVTVDGIGIRRR